MSLASLVRGASKTVGGAFRTAGKTITNAGSTVFRPVKSVFTTTTGTVESLIQSASKAFRNLGSGTEHLVSGVATGAARTGTVLKYLVPVSAIAAVGILGFVGYQYLMAPKRAAFG